MPDGSFDKPIRFVLPWYGPDIAGGAETLARLWLERLAARGLDVEALTTCGESLSGNWNANPRPSGVETINGVTVRRFKSRHANRRLYHRLNRRLLLGDELARDEEEAFITESIRSKGMEEHIRDECADAALIFLPYLYGTTWWGARIHSERSILLPCLHKESYAAMSIMDDLHRRARGLIFNSAEEESFARRRYDIEGKPSIVLGLGVEPDVDPNAQRFRVSTGIMDDVICYFGRRDESKRTPDLIDYFCRYVDQTDHNVRLVVGGQGVVDIPARYRDRVHDLGFVDEETKHDAMAASVVVCQPSDRESFSIVLMEGWMCGAPSLVNGNCEVTRERCRASGGGLFFRSYPEFAESLEYLIEHPEERAAMAESGRQYALERYGWDDLIDRFLAFLNETLD